jgi:outer membrane immunogenic protein
MKRLAIVFSALAVGAVTASAADLAPRYTKAPPAVAPVVTNWTGFYVGVDGGWGWNVNSGAGAVFNPLGTVSGLGTAAPIGNVEKASGGFAGGAAGYNFQSGAFVWGLETDIQWSDIKGSVSVVDPCCNPTFTGSGVFTASQNLTWFGTTRGRIGWLASPNLLLFVTGGAFYGHENLAASLSFPPTSVIYPSAASMTRVGGTVGAGFEYLFANSLSAKLEGLYYDMGTVTTSFTCPAPGVTCATGFGVTGTFALRGAIVRAGLNWHFNPSPVVAKY